MRVSRKLIVKKTMYGNGLFAKVPIAKGEMLTIYTGPISNKFSEYCVSVGKNRFLGGGPKADCKADYINHGCNPNAYIKYLRGKWPELRALRDIKVSEHISLNYLTCDWDLNDKPFKCKCGSKNCFGWIRGFKFLTKRQRRRLLNQGLAPYLRQELVKPMLKM